MANNETIFTTCDDDQKSDNHLLEGIRILTLNETYEAYAIHDILVRSKINYHDDYSDLTT